MSEKCKSTSPTKNQVKNQQTTICTDWKLDMISQLEKGKQIVNICHNVRLCVNSGTKCLCSKATAVILE